MGKRLEGIKEERQKNHEGSIAARERELNKIIITIEIR